MQDLINKNELEGYESSDEENEMDEELNKEKNEEEDDTLLK